MVVMTSNFHCGSPGSIPWRSQVYFLLLPRNCKMRGIEDVGTMELVCLGGLLRMGGDSGDGFTGNGELDVRAGT